MRTRNPLWVADWNQSFPPALARLLLDRHGPRLENVLVIFPHKRPVRYLARALAPAAQRRGGLRLPQMLAVEELFSHLHEELTPAPAVQASYLDRAAVLLEGLRTLEGSGPLAELAADPRLAFPWCARLADLCEEFLRMGLTPTRLDHTEDRVAVWASALLARLGELFAAYVQGLHGAGLATPGLIARQVAAQAGEAAATLSATANHVYLAGFHLLTATEKTLFLELEHQGLASFVLHTDPALATGGRMDDAARAHEQLADLLATDVHLLTPPEGNPEPAKTPNVRFIQAYDLHSQLAALQRELGDDPPGETAVVIPDSTLLVPVLHHLPERDVNVSMGYPLERTALFDLVDTLCRLHEETDETGYRAKDLLALLRHPYLRLLKTPGGSQLAPALRGLEESVLLAGRRIRHEQLAAMRPPADDPRFAELSEPDLEQALAAVAVCLRPFAQAKTLHGLAAALDGVVQMLLHMGAELWPVHVLDAEALERLARTVLPELERSRLSQVDFPPRTLCSILRQALAAQRVPFEAEPLTGLQVLGLLETRLLSFKRVFVLQATENQLPGPPPDDPLLPDGLRRLVGLPDGRHRDSAMAYTLMRLLHASPESTLLYPAGAQSGGILDGKALRSRFVEQLLWQEEQRRGQLIKPGQGPLGLESPALSALGRHEPGAPMTSAAAEQLQRVLARPLSPTMLDTALGCPLKFYYRYLARLAPPQDLSEEGDPAALGQAVHDALADLLRPRLNRSIRAEHLDRADLHRLLDERLNESGFVQRLAHDARLGMTMTLRARLDGFMDNFPATVVAALEQDYSGTLQVDGQPCKVQGRIDRLDQRDGETVLLDYKTGKAPAPAAAWFKDPDLSARLEGWRPTHGHDLPAHVADKAKSLQMPVYLWLLSARHDPSALSAAWVELGAGGRETSYFPVKYTPQARAEFITVTTPNLLALAVRYVNGLGHFAPRPSPRCRYCDYAPCCDAPKPAW